MARWRAAAGGGAGVSCIVGWAFVRLPTDTSRQQRAQHTRVHQQQLDNKERLVTIRFAALLATILLAGCGFVSFEDVSNDPAYSRYVGTAYRTTADMTVYRVSMDRDYGPAPSIYKIVQPPGFDGREVISRTRFPAGSTLTVLTIQRCKDCYLDAEPRVHATVRITSTTQFDDQEVRADLGLLSSHMQAVDKPAPGN